MEKFFTKNDIKFFYKFFSPPEFFFEKLKFFWDVGRENKKG